MCIKATLKVHCKTSDVSAWISLGHHFQTNCITLQWIVVSLSNFKSKASLKDFFDFHENSYSSCHGLDTSYHKLTHDDRYQYETTFDQSQMLFRWNTLHRLSRRVSHKTFARMQSFVAYWFIAYVTHQMILMFFVTILQKIKNCTDSSISIWFTIAFETASDVPNLKPVYRWMSRTVHAILHGI